jgi:hypothetical protein
MHAGLPTLRSGNFARFGVLILMARVAPPLLGLGCVLALAVACFKPVLFGGEQFAYRDAGHFYYPLYLRVQQEWNAGRWPLWDPGRNGGTPLLGMPMAAVLYPGKVLYAALPYPWAARLYVIAHVAIAFLGMLAFARSLGTSWTGGWLGGMAYAFGAPVLFQYSNVIFLVGAAWAPWGFRAADRLLRLGERRGLPELGAVLALQTLGGDPEAAYFTAVFGVIEAVVLALWLGLGSTSWWWRAWPRVLAVAVVGWFAFTLAAAWKAPRIHVPKWLPAPSTFGNISWGIAGLIVLIGWLRNRPRARLGPMLTVLAAACALALLLTAAQLGPSWELARISTRARGGAGERMLDFSVEPYRLLEAVWPHFFGVEGPENSSWIQAISPIGERMLWTPSLYMGGLTLVLALGAFGRGGASPTRSWLAIVTVVGLAAGMGTFGSPLWLSRWIPGVPDWLGSHDPPGRIGRLDAYPSDDASNLYGLLAAIMPGFSLFRYPAKLLTFSCLAVSGLAGLGWDRLVRGESRAVKRSCAWALIATLTAQVPALAARGLAVSALSRRVPRHTLFGLVDVSAGLNETIRALFHGSFVYAAVLGLSAVSGRRPRLAGAAGLLLMAIDLALANARLVWSVPQSEFDVVPVLARMIEDAERTEASAGPFRIHRVEQWHPKDFNRRGSPERLQEVVAWERGTLDHLYALPEGLDYTVRRGLIDLGEFNEFFEVQTISSRDVEGASRSITIHPRRGYDLWNARYFLLPVDLNGWIGQDQGFTRLYPPDEIVADPERSSRWIARQGWQLLRNRNAFPRAWIVHEALARKPSVASSDTERTALIQDLIVHSDPLASGTGRPVYDLRESAFVESDDPSFLSTRLPGGRTSSTESVAVTRSTPHQVEIRAVLERPGLVVLADTFYPGWRITIDGSPAPILRTNRLMRGALVQEGTHTLVYSYEPTTFRIGGWLTVLGLVIVIGLIPWAARGGTGPANLHASFNWSAPCPNSPPTIP